MLGLKSGRPSAQLSLIGLDEARAIPESHSVDECALCGNFNGIPVSFSCNK